MKIKVIPTIGFASVISVASFAFQESANAAIVRIGKSAFTPQAGLITFSEFSRGTVNPTYSPVNYGGNPATAPTVTFDGFFQGQTLSANPTIDCPGGAATGCVVGTPTGSLALDPISPDTFITGDGANPTSPVLSGSPIFNGPVSILFDKDVAGVGLDGGFFNAPESTAITAFARDGSVLGSVKNVGTGIEFLGLVTDDGSEKIAGLQFSLIGPEPAGFAIDNLYFGRAGEVKPPEPPQKTPEPASMLGLLAISVLGATSTLKDKKSS
jgi:hypothetical protein